jgi:hypothetical protein
LSSILSPAERNTWKKIAIRAEADLISSKNRKLTRDEKR